MLTTPITFHALRRRWPLLAAAALSTASFAVAMPLAAASSAAATGHTPAARAKPTIVLVHGAWADPSSFAPVVTRLQTAGFTVLNEPNPLRGLSSYAAYLDAFIDHRTTRRCCSKPSPCRGTSRRPDVYRGTTHEVAQPVHAISVTQPVLSDVSATFFW